jgi:hypothetical protein
MDNAIVSLEGRKGKVLVSLGASHFRPRQSGCPRSEGDIIESCGLPEIKRQRILLVGENQGRLDAGERIRYVGVYNNRRKGNSARSAEEPG